MTRGIAAGICIFLLYCFYCEPSAVACVTQNPLAPRTGDPSVDFLIALANRESSGDAGCVNGGAYLGLFQMGGSALQDAGFYRLGQSDLARLQAGLSPNAWDGAFSERAEFVGVTSRNKYLQYAGAQELAVRAYHDSVWKILVKWNLDQKLGAVIDGIKLTKSGMIAGAHLVGPFSLKQFVTSNGKIIKEDGNRTPITQYIRNFGSFY